jgi:hypothetical protein
MVEEGVTEIDDVLKDRLAQLKADRERTRAALDRIKTNSARSAAIEPEAIEKFSRFTRENVASGAIPFRKPYIRSKSTTASSSSLATKRRWDRRLGGR